MIGLPTSTGGCSNRPEIEHLVVGSGGVDHVPDDGADLDPSLSFNR